MMPYELFLDEQGEKISKTRGNGLSLQTILTFGRAVLGLAKLSPSSTRQINLQLLEHVYAQETGVPLSKGFNIKRALERRPQSNQDWTYHYRLAHGPVSEEYVRDVNACYRLMQCPAPSV